MYWELMAMPPGGKSVPLATLNRVVAPLPSMAARRIEEVGVGAVPQKRFELL